MEIIGREAPKKLLDKLLKSKQAEFLALTGRRRVGKTFLIREYLKKHLSFDFTGSYDTPKEIQLQNFFAEYQTRSKSKEEKSVPTNWSQAFRLLASHLDTLPKTKKQVVFIDEIPWLDTHKSGFVSALGYFWNQHVSKMNNILLVICGSANSWVHTKILKSKGGLYNRVTATIKLSPFTLKETEQFCKSKGVNLSRYQILQLYMVMGGIPHYLKEIEKGLSAVQIIDKTCFSKSGLLKNEFDQLYPSIFNQVENHLAVISALAKRPQGLVRNDIVRQSGLKDGGIITRTLQELLDSEFIRISLPFNKRKRQAIYALSDMFSMFYFKFIKSNKLNGDGTWMKLSRGASYTAWSGYAFEHICFSHLDKIKQTLGISGVYTNCSSWKYLGDEYLNGTQIDLLIDRDDQIVNICEAKFTKDSFLISKKYAEELRHKSSIFKQITKTKKSVHPILLTTYPAIKNGHYLEQVQGEVNMDDLF